MTAVTDTDLVPDRRARGRGRSRARLRLVLMLLLPLVLVLAGAGWYLSAGRYVATDDAYVQADTVSISSDVAGRVVAVEVHDNQQVKQGEPLFRLDDRPFRIAESQAAAQLANARLQVEGLRAQYQQKQAELKAAQDTLAFQQRQFERQRELLATHVTSQQAFDQAQHNFDAARQQVAATQQQLANVLASLGGDANIATESHPLVQQAQAQLDQARLNLGYTTVYAPANGIVTKVDKLPVGTYVGAAQPVFSLVATDHVWVEANYKETDLAHMQVGQTATVTVDAYPGETFEARVASLSPGTGAQFAVLPPQNATGNWVKVVQRVPVRLAIESADPARPLRAGMSVTADVDTRYVKPLFASIERFLGVGEAAARTAR
jgi:membrane fusion protein (multidrug efflux system)